MVDILVEEVRMEVRLVHMGETEIGPIRDEANVSHEDLVESFPKEKNESVSHDRQEIIP